jgi:hypothetical protein
MEEVPVGEGGEGDGGVPPELAAFWREYNVPDELLPKAATEEDVRYFRLTRKAADDEAGLAAGLAELGAQPVGPGLPGFYRMSANVGLSSSVLYEQGRVMGCDLSSGAAVLLGLDVQPGHHVLDLCCAPGMKMLLMSELVGETGSVTGVDPNEMRLSVARNVLRKYDARRVRLFLCPGERFSFLAPPSAEESELEIEAATRAGRKSYSYMPVALRTLKDGAPAHQSTVALSFNGTDVDPKAARWGTSCTFIPLIFSEPKRSTALICRVSCGRRIIISALIRTRCTTAS